MMLLKYLTVSIFLICIVKESAVQAEDDFHLDQMFGCSADGDNNTIHIDTAFQNLKSISLLSPCYPNSYYGQCAYQREVCYVVVYNIPQNMWIGLSADEDFSVPESNDELTLLTHEPEEKRFQLNSLMPGYLHRFTQYNDSAYTIVFVRLPFPSNSAGDDTYKFKIDTRLAYVLGKSYGHEGSVAAGNGGYIVSHEMFDYGTDINNYYSDDIVVELTLTGLSVDDTIRVTFLFFDLHLYYWSYYCYDYLEVTGIRGYPSNTAHVCGNDKPTNDVYELHPVGESITFRFVTSSYWSYGTSAGFLLEYKVIKEMKCPPQIQNANKGVQVEDTEVYIIVCKVNYWTENRSNIQLVNCTSDIWQSTILPCIPIECELPEISTDRELNFTMSSTGRATVGTNISYSCNSKRYELTDGAEISTCTSNGEWSSPTPRCTLIETTETTPAHIEPSKHTTERNTTTMANKQETESSAKSMGPTAGYIAGGVGGAGAVILIVVVVLLLLRRRKSRNAESDSSHAPTKVPLDDLGNANTESNAADIADSSTPTYETAVRDPDIHLYEITNQQHSTYENVGGNNQSEPNPYESTDIPNEPHLYDKVTMKN